MNIGSIMKTINTTNVMGKGIGAAAGVIALGYASKMLNDNQILTKKVTVAGVETIKPDRMMRGAVFMAAGLFLPSMVKANLGKGMSSEIVDSVFDAFILAGANLLLEEYLPDVTQGGLSAIGGVENIYDPSAYINAAQNAVSNYINCAKCDDLDTRIYDEQGNELLIDSETGQPVKYVMDELIQEQNDCSKYLQR